MDFIFIVGRILFGALMLIAGFSHFGQFTQMKKLAESKKVLIPSILVPLSGLLLVLGGISFVFWFLPQIGAWSLLLFFIPVNFTMHRFWNEKDSVKRTYEMHNFLGNLSVIGLLLIVLEIL
jgi:putative oxidoreductase